ncbi:MAG: isoprenylcysteine carboxylmethyltransferase family protein [Gemmatimonadetes bacterium]|nr:isoprenylcysteine carboxylmethyltransferase family protein [Gemmatimonadota bacterium]
MSTPPRDLGPAVPFPPPILFAGGLGVGAALQRFVPLPPMPDVTAVRAVGFVLAVLGLGLMYTGILTFRRFRTAVYPNRPAKLVVDTGVYAYTRNPMYLGMTVFYVGASLLMGTWWVPLLLPVVLVTLRTQVIAREERHLHERFPDAYAAYCARVRRWV